MRKTTDSEKLYIWVVICLAVMFCVWLLAISTAMATERQMSTTNCQGIANDLYVVAQMRDAQKDEKEVEALVERVLTPHLGEEGSYIQYQTDIVLMVSMVHAIYTSAVPAKQIAQWAFDTCQEHGFGVNEV